jgi:hypothetical protein
MARLRASSLPSGSPLVDQAHHLGDPCRVRAERTPVSCQPICCPAMARAIRNGTDFRRGATHVASPAGSPAATSDEGWRTVKMRGSPHGRVQRSDEDRVTEVLRRKVRERDIGFVKCRGVPVVSSLN